VSFNIDPLEFPPNWQGLYNRKQAFPDEDPHLYAAMAENVEFYGSVMKKRQGSALLNGLCDYSNAVMASGATVLPPLHLENWAHWTDSMVAGTVVKVQIMDPADPHYTEVVTFTISGTYTTTPTVTPAAPYTIPAGSVVLAIPQTAGKRIGGLFQAGFRNGARPLLVVAVDNVTGVVSVHLQGNRQCRPFNLFQRIAQTTVASWGPGNLDFNYGYLTSTEGLQVGDWIHFPAAAAGTQNARVHYVSSNDRLVWIDGATPILPLPVAGNVVRFLPSTCPGVISAANPIGLGKIAGASSGNRTLLAIKQFPPLRYAHTYSDVTVSMSSVAPYHTFGLTSMFGLNSTQAAALVGRQVVISDLQGGQTHLRTISAVSGTSMTVTPDLPWQIVPGALVDVIALSRVGLRAPVVPPSVTFGTTGSVPAGSYSVRVTFSSQEGGTYVESEACPPSARAYPPAVGNLLISNIPVPLDPRVEKVRLYRTSSGGDGVWYYIAEVAPGTTSYNEIKSDSSLGVQLDEFVNYPPYETMEVVAEWPHAQRLMGIAQVGHDAWAVVWSDGPDVKRGQMKPESWPVDNFLFVGMDSGDRPRGIAAFYDSMLIFCERSIWRIQGNPPDLVVEPVNFQQHDQSGIGIESHQSLVVDQNEVIFPGPDGVYLIDRFQGVATGFQSQRISRQIDGLWDATYAQIRMHAHAVFYRSGRQYRLFWPLAVGTYHDPEIVLTYQFDADVNGAPHFWATWHLTQSIPVDHTFMVSSTVAEPEPGDAYLFASVKEANYVGTRDGAVIGMDYYYTGSGNGFADFTHLPFHMEYRTLYFNPAGQFGLTALGRFLHAVLGLGIPTTVVTGSPAPKRTLTLELRVGEFEQPVIAPPYPPRVTLEIPPRGANVAPDWLNLYRFVLLCRGQYHQIGFIDDVDRAVELHRMTYFFQRLPETMILEDLVQAEPID
jgi:hypothetical protein